MLWIFAKVVLAYVAADAISGLYHWLTDKGMNFRGQIEMFQEHHVTNTMQGFDWQTFAAGLPAMIVGAWIHSPFLLALGFFGAMTQCTHYYAHRRSRNRVINSVVRALQELRIIVHPASHQRHHTSQKFDRDFCLLSGWNNWWLNRIVGFFERRNAPIIYVP
jgi:hypothetical protein